MVPHANIVSLWRIWNKQSQPVTLELTTPCVRQTIHQSSGLAFPICILF